MLENPMVSGYGFSDKATGRPFFRGLVEQEHEKNEGEVTCEECSETIIVVDAHESLLWEDTYICEGKQCIDKHYTGATERI